MAELLAVGTTALRSSDFTVAAGTKLTVFLKAAAGPVVPIGSQVHLQIKTGSEYFTVATLSGRLNESAGVIGGDSAATVTYALYREASTAAVGADSL